MITFEEALAKAKQRKPNIDGYSEWDNGWVFTSNADAGYVGGYGHTSIVVRKSDGKILDMPSFVYEGAGEYIHSFTL